MTTRVPDHWPHDIHDPTWLGCGKIVKYNVTLIHEKLLVSNTGEHWQQKGLLFWFWITMQTAYNPQLYTVCLL